MCGHNKKNEERIKNSNAYPINSLYFNYYKQNLNIYILHEN